VKRILLVDDQIDIRRMLRAALETLDAEIEILDVPSGEEALLEAVRSSVDLLISDLRLAGMSGLELKRKLAARLPDIQVILMTGVTDPDVRRQAAEAGAAAFFIKPVEIADFLDAVERCLGLTKAAFPLPPIEEVAPPSPKPLAERLAVLRQEIHALSVTLLDDHGRALVMAGTLPDPAFEATFLPSLMAAFSAAGRIAQLTGMGLPEELLYFAGSEYDLYLCHVGQSYGLLVVANLRQAGENLGTISSSIQRAVRDLLAILTGLGVPVQLAEQPAVMPITATPVEQPAFDVEQIFQPERVQPINSAEVEAFWDMIIESADTTATLDPDAITYEQAQRLGLTPEAS
jgi:CheY-like chemotaxis protein